MTDTVTINGIDCGKISEADNAVELSALVPTIQNKPYTLGCQSHIQVGDTTCSNTDWKVADGTNSCAILDSKFVDTPVLDDTATKFTFKLDDITTNVTAPTVPTDWTQTENYMGAIVDNCLGTKVYLKLDSNDILDDGSNTKTFTINIASAQLNNITPRNVCLFATNSMEISGIPDTFYGKSNSGTTYQVNTDAANNDGNNMNDNRYNATAFTNNKSLNYYFVPYKDNTIKKTTMLTAENQRSYIDITDSGTLTRYFIGIIWYAVSSTDHTDNALNLIPWDSPIYANMYNLLIPYTYVNPTLRYEVNSFYTNSEDSQTKTNAGNLWNSYSTEMLGGTAITTLPPTKITISTSNFPSNDISASNPLTVSYVCILSNGQAITPYSESTKVGVLQSTTTSAEIDWLDISTVTGPPFTGSSPATYTNSDISSIYTIQATSVMVYAKFGPKDNSKWDWKVFERVNSPDGSNFATYMHNKDYMLQSYNTQASGSTLAIKWSLYFRMAVTKGTNDPYVFDSTFAEGDFVNQKLCVSNFTMSTLTPITSIWSNFNTKAVDTVVDWAGGAVQTYGTDQGWETADLANIIIRSVVNTEQLYGG